MIAALRSAADRKWRVLASLCATLALAGLAGTAAASGDELALPEEPTELATVPERPRPIVEFGQPYLSPSRLAEGWTLPTGAVWQPSLLLWGTLRSALQGEFGRPADAAEWATRIDLFGQLAFTPTERIVVGIEPLQEGSDFSGYRFGRDGEQGEFVGGLDGDLEALFFEGDVGELFPRLDRLAPIPLDLGFMVGRVPVVFQDGLLIDDAMTGVGLVQNSILAGGTSNLRVSSLFVWDGVHRGGTNRDGGAARLFGLFAELDRPETTWALDLAYADGESDTDGFFAGVSGIRRLWGRWNLTGRALGSWAIGDASAEVGRGLLLVLAVSVAPQGTHDVVYLNLVGSAGRYTAAARAADRGGPLGRVGILFEAPGLGSIGAPLANDAERMFGAALGYQRFFAGRRGQIVLELAGRTRHDGAGLRAIGGVVRVQRAIGRRMVLRLDLYGVSERAAAGARGFGGARGELLIKF